MIQNNKSNAIPPKPTGTSTIINPKAGQTTNTVMPPPPPKPVIK